MSALPLAAKAPSSINQGTEFVVKMISHRTHPSSIKEREDSTGQAEGHRNPNTNPLPLYFYPNRLKAVLGNFQSDKMLLYPSGR